MHQWREISLVNGGDDTYLWLCGARAYLGGSTVLNKICGLYKNDLAEEVRSLTPNDINTMLGVNDISLVNINNAYYGYYNYGEPFSCSSKVFYTPESYVRGTYCERPVEGIVSGYTYSINKACKEGLPFVQVDDKIYEILFEDAENIWLNSSFVDVRDTGYGYGLPEWRDVFDVLSRWCALCRRNPLNRISCRLLCCIWS